MKRIFITAITLLLTLVTATAASAGSDSPTPYEVTPTGIYLPEGDVFEAHGHVNVDYYAPGEQYRQQANVHFDPNNNHPGGQWIGESFLPWSALSIPDGSRIMWVQIHGYNEHFGEGGQKPITTGPKPDPSHETREREETGDWTPEPLCETWETEWTKTTWIISEERESTIVWSSEAQDWEEVWTDWEETDRQVIDTKTRTEQMDPNDTTCGLPPTGAPVAGLVGVALLLTVGGALAVRRAHR